MSRPLIAGLLLAVLAGPAAAQRPETRTAAELRTLVDRVAADVARAQRQRVAAESASAGQRAGRRTTSGDLETVFWDAVPVATATAIVRSADSLLAEGQVVTPAFLRGRVFVMAETSDTTVLGAPDLASRRRVDIGTLNLRTLTPASVDPVLQAVAREFQATLDKTWNDWLGYAAELVRTRTAMVARGARGELTEPLYATAEQCLAGSAAGCRLWLGLDADSAPFRTRYTAAELRRHIREGYGRSADVNRCIQNDDEACYRIAGSRLNYSGTDDVPASLTARLSLLLAVRDLQGATALRLALADTSGAIGERLARASGVDEDTLVLAWRGWLLAGGRAQHVRAGPGDLAAALLATGLLLYLATRSGRWT